MNARNAFANGKTPEQNRQFNMGLRGPIVKGKTSIRLNLDGRRDQQSDTITALEPDGNRRGDTCAVRSEPTNVTMGIEHALTNNQTLRLEYGRGYSATENLGVGGFNLPERASTLRAAITRCAPGCRGSLARPCCNEVRLQLNTQDNSRHRCQIVPPIIVLDAFSRRRGESVDSSGHHASSSADNLDFNVGSQTADARRLPPRGRHYENFDARITPGRSRSAASRRTSAVADTFTQRIGQVEHAFAQYNLGFYWSDDIRLNNKLSFGIGVRNETAVAHRRPSEPDAARRLHVDAVG